MLFGRIDNAATTVQIPSYQRVPIDPTVCIVNQIICAEFD